MAKLNPKSKGAFGEQITTNYLINNGYTIVKRNYTSRYGEIDIIAKNENYIVFTEVKTRGANRMYDPSLAVTKSKQMKIIKTATIFMENFTEELQPRFDVSEVITSATYPYNVIELNYFDSAFNVN